MKTSFIEGEGRVVFGGAIQLAIATRQDNGHKCLLFSEMDKQKQVGDEITDDELEAIKRKGQIYLEFADKESVLLVATMLKKIYELLDI